MMFSRYLPDVDCLGVADDVKEGVSLIQATQPDLVFMDIQLRSGNCFDLLKQLDRYNFDIIFTTSHEEHALKAFRLAAVDYLVKPVLPHDLLEAVNKLKAKNLYKNTLSKVESLLAGVAGTGRHRAKVALPTLTGFRLVAVEDIIRCESDNTYTTFYLNEGKPILVSKTLKCCEQLLQDHAFMRVHNSTLINLKYVREYVRGEGGTIIMTDGAEIQVARRRKDAFLEQFRAVRL